jgi:hypothetical protein
VLTLATGLRGYKVDDRVPSILPNGQAGSPRPVHIRLTVPAEGAPLLELVRAIVEQEKPAHLTAEVMVAAPEQEEPLADHSVPMPPAAGPVAVGGGP